MADAANAALNLPRNPVFPPPDGETSVNIYGYTPWLSICILSVIVFGIGFFAHIAYAIYPRFAKRQRDILEKGSHGSDHVHGKSSDSYRHGSIEDGGEHQPHEGVNGTEVDGLSHRQWIGWTVTFESLFAVGCALEVIGYAFRAASHFNPFVLVSFVLNYFMIVVAPVFFAASIYFCLSVILQKHKSYAPLLPISGRAIVAIFVTVDCVCVVVQITGAALIGVSASAYAQGNEQVISLTDANNILIAGLSVQVFAFAVFVSLLSWLIVQLLRGKHISRSQTNGQGRSNTSRPPWLLLTILLISALLIYLRTLYRLAEAAQGVASSSATDQGLFVALETVPVLVAVALWTLLPFPRLVR